MAYEYRPGMKMYEVVWERDGKRVGTFCTHAANEADALSEAEAFFAEHREHDFPGGRDGTTARDHPRPAGDPSRKARVVARCEADC